MRAMIASSLAASALAACTGLSGRTAPEPVTLPHEAELATPGEEPATEPAVVAQATPEQLMPARDGQAHRYELRAFADGHVEVWMDGTRVPDERIYRRDSIVAVLGSDGGIVERLDLPSNWTPSHGTPPEPGTYVTFDGKVLVPPAVMLGGRLEPVSPAVVAHLHAEHTAPDGGQCSALGMVIPGLPLAQAGIRPHDIIVAVDGSPNASPEAIRAVVRAKKPGDAIAFSVVRAGRRTETTVTLAAWDPKHMVRPLGAPMPKPPTTAASHPAGGAAPATPAPAAVEPPPAVPTPAPAATPAAEAELAAARARIAELEQQMKSESAVRKAIRPQPAPPPPPQGSAPSATPSAPPR